MMKQYRYHRFETVSQYYREVAQKVSNTKYETEMTQRCFTAYHIKIRMVRSQPYIETYGERNPCVNGRYDSRLPFNLLNRIQFLVPICVGIEYISEFIQGRGLCDYDYVWYHPQRSRLEQSPTLRPSDPTTK